MKAKELLNKGHKKVAQWIRRNNYIEVYNYEENGNTIIEFAKIGAGITINSVIIVFNKNWKVIEVK